MTPSTTKALLGLALVAGTLGLLIMAAQYGQHGKEAAAALDATAGDSGDSLTNEPASPSVAPPTREPAEQPPATDASPMQHQLQEVAEAYRHSSRFPSYSVPLQESDWQLLNPRAFIPTEMPIKGEDDLSVRIELAHYIADIQQPLPVRVITSYADRPVQGVAIILGKGSSTTRLTIDSDQPGLRSFQGILQPETLAAAGTGEVAVIANLELAGGKRADLATVVELYRSDATLLRLGDAYVDGAHLMIPAHFEVHTPGLFRIQANLYDAESAAPVSHLNSSFALSGGKASGLLKVHAVTLRAQDAAGPYQLKDINIVRSPERPGVATGYGSAEAEAYQVNGFSLDSYSDADYVDPQTQQRLEFLDRLAQ